MTVAQFALRVVGIAFASVVMVLLLAVLSGGARTAAAASQPTGLGDLLDPGSSVGSLLAPVTEPVDDVLAPILDPVTQPLAPVVAPVTGTVDPVLEPVLDVVVSPIVDTVVPVVDTVVVPIVVPVVDAVVVPVVDTLRPVSDAVVVPIVDIVVPPAADTVRPPASEPVRPGTVPTTPAVTPLPPADSGTAITPTVPLAPMPLEPAMVDIGAAAATVEIAGIDSPAASTARLPDLAGAGHVADPEPTRTATGVMSASLGARSASFNSFTWFPARSIEPASLPSIVGGLLTGASSAAPSPGASSPLLAVLTTTVAAMFLLSRRVTAEVSWRSALVFSSVERPG